MTGDLNHLYSKKNKYLLFDGVINDKLFIANRFDCGDFRSLYIQ